MDSFTDPPADNDEDESTPAEGAGLETDGGTVDERQNGAAQTTDSEANAGAASLVEEAEDSATDSSEWPDHDHLDEPGAAEDTQDSGIDDDGAGISDEQLTELLEEQSTNITVVGCGGAGCNTVTRMVEEGITGANLAVANTDVQHLVQTDAETKIFIGENETGGRGAGSLPQVGEQAAQESRDEIRTLVEGEDMVFVTAGMGGGTGTGAAPVVAETAQAQGALTVSIVTLPFTSEGEVRRSNAEAGIERLRDASDTVIVVPNDRILDVAPGASVKKAFKIADEILMRSVKGVTELITETGMVNLDFSDVTTVMEGGGVAMIGLGESSAETHKARDAVNDALDSPLLDVDVDDADSVLVNVTGGPGMAIEDAEGVVENIYDRVDPGARIIWGTNIDENLDDTIRSLVLITGVDSPHIYGSADGEPTPAGEERAEPEEEDGHDIDHVV